jgi:hypothetical protein|tara:strand:+ start:248 stop:409 length:162 start_codon:yes stop_codon:yes gene_type:complete
MNKLPRLQSLLNTLINPSLRTKKEKIKIILNKNEKELKQYTKELNKKMKGLKC